MINTKTKENQEKQITKKSISPWIEIKKVQKLSRMASQERKSETDEL